MLASFGNNKDKCHTRFINILTSRSPKCIDRLQTHRLARPRCKFIYLIKCFPICLMYETDNVGQRLGKKLVQCIYAKQLYIIPGTLVTK
jgi:hypothetical protein